MAKGKHAVALFEVIHKDKRFDRKGDAPDAPAADDSRELAKQAVELWRKKHSDPETWTPPGPTIGERFAVVTARMNALSGAIRMQAVQAANACRLWLSRTNGFAPGAAAAAIIIAAMLAARHFIHPAVPAPTFEDALRAEPPHPSVLIVASQDNQELTAAQKPAAPQPLSPEMLADEQQASQKTIVSIAAPGQRVVNMHYVLMQSYFEEKTATEACDFLNRNGIPCTIERGVKGWRSDMYQVIGLQGFVRASGPQYLAYRHNVEQLGEKFSPKSHYKRFQPQAIKW